MEAATEVALQKARFLLLPSTTSVLRRQQCVCKLGIDLIIHKSMNRITVDIWCGVAG